jgi:Uncharacterized protein conserved in bacteria (DUF2087)
MSTLSSPLLQGLATLVVKDGVALGGLSADERNLALSLVWAGLAVEPCNERQINEQLKAQLAGPARCLGTDHVELRRWLVDVGWLQRDGFGREYRRVDEARLPAALQANAAALAGLHTAAWVQAQRGARAERRAARRQQWQGGARP